MAINYTKGEELLNSWSHGVGAVLALVMGVIFLYWCYGSGDGWGSLAVWLYLTGMLSSYVASTVYHALPSHWRAKEVLRKWDHAAIYWHIAGSYSPVTLVALRNQGWWGWGLFIFVWTCAIVGTIMSFARLKEHSNAETICFVLMGLSGLIALKPLVDTIPTAFVWIVAEGVCYITGALFYSLHKRPYMHSVFHFFVLAGSICHIIAVWDILVH
ncbi:MAG: hemolysin III family protein [Bacteroidaceae bacterium]|nr:hemolysin III family protein [Bacteroidaceae bacterium]